MLVAQVMSPESEERDREDKPGIYAELGIATYWLIERGKDDAPIVHEFRLINGGYRLKKTHLEVLRTGVPFALEIPLLDPTR